MNLKKLVPFVHPKGYKQYRPDEDLFTVDGVPYASGKGESFCHETSFTDDVFRQTFESSVCNTEKAETGLICRCGCDQFRLRYGVYVVNGICANCGNKGEVYSG